MGFIFIMIVSTVFGVVGLWIGNFFGMAAGLSISTVASLVGYYYGYKWNREYFC